MSEQPVCMSTIMRKARKIHRCCECGGEIKVKDSYQYTSGIWDGRPSSFKQCKTCAEVFNAATDFSDYDEFPCFMGLKDWLSNYFTYGMLKSESINNISSDLRVSREKILHACGRMGEDDE